MKLLCILISLLSALASGAATTDLEDAALEERQVGGTCVPGLPVLNAQPKSTIKRQIKLFAVDPKDKNSQRFPVGNTLNPVPGTFNFAVQTFAPSSPNGGVFILQNNALYGNGALSTFANGSGSGLNPQQLYFSSDIRSSPVDVQAALVCNASGKLVQALVFTGPAANISFGSPTIKQKLKKGLKLFKPLTPILNQNEVHLEIALV